MAEKKKKKETNSSCLMPGQGQAVATLIGHIRSQQREEEKRRVFIAAFEEVFSPPSSESPSDSSMKNPPRVPPPKTQRASLFLPPPRVSVKKPSDSHRQKTQSEQFSETDSVISSVSMRSDSSRFQPPSFNLQKTPSEADSTDSGVSVRSDSSMSQPLNFNLQKKQSQLTEELSSCSLCEEAMKDPVPLLCGHKSCKQCVHSFRNEFGSTAEYPCKKCRRSEREKRDQDLQSVLLEKQIKRVEMETEKLQAEKEKFDLEKKKLALEIQSLELKGKYTNYDQGVVIPKTKIPYL